MLVHQRVSQWCHGQPNSCQMCCALDKNKLELDVDGDVPVRLARDRSARSSASSACWKGVCNKVGCLLRLQYTIRMNTHIYRIYIYSIYIYIINYYNYYFINELWLLPFFPMITIHHFPGGPDAMIIPESCSADSFLGPIIPLACWVSITRRKGFYDVILVGGFNPSDKY